ncbi:MAG: ABC transporter permease subunit [Candidatus Heimdallarchaeota archaeon]|nr:ABC transporter permease subunit [Candidatus Heimdallarchaeota archaeon]MBY8993576.1 ABC transporter permease subunit [Candidatus Heimdallarchaeota archaeon]
MIKGFFKKIRKDKISIIFRKEVRELLKNKEILVTVILMPIIFSILIPMSMITLNFAEGQEIPEGDQVPEIFRNLATYWDESSDLQKVTIVQTNLYLAFLIMIPMIVPMAISSDSIAGEKERKTIEGLLAAPVTKEEILIGKALAAAVPSIVISWVAEIIYITITDIIVYNLMGSRLILPNLFAVIMFFLLMPTQTLLSTLLMTSFSSKAKGSREALQKSGFFAMPIIFLVSAVIFLPLLVHPALTLASEVILILLMFIILKRATKNFNRNKLLSVGS